MESGRRIRRKRWNSENQKEKKMLQKGLSELLVHKNKELKLTIEFSTWRSLVTGQEKLLEC